MGMKPTKDQIIKRLSDELAYAREFIIRFDERSEEEIAIAQSIKATLKWQNLSALSLEEVETLAAAVETVRQVIVKVGTVQ